MKMTSSKPQVFQALSERKKLKRGKSILFSLGVPSPIQIDAMIEITDVLLDDVLRQMKESKSRLM